MPQTTPERAARWTGGDVEAIAHLRSGGWTLHRDWSFSHPEKRQPTDTERDAAQYLIEEWDFAGLAL